jgi:hypothetical protein
VAIVASSRRKKYDAAQRAVIIRWGAYFLLPLALMPFLAAWYFSTVPAASRDLALGGAVAMTFIFAFGAVTSFLVSLYAMFGMLRRSRDINLETALLMAAIAFIATASMEFVREGIRKPYVLMEIMYSNGILKTDLPRLREEGLLVNTPWIVPDTTKYAGEVAVGEAVYRAQCLRCHEIEGYNAVTPLVKHWNLPLVMSALDHMDRLKGFMPPFIGTEAEKTALAAYLLTLTSDGLAADSVSVDSTGAVDSTGSLISTEEGEQP